METGHIFPAGRLDKKSQQRVVGGVKAMTAHNGVYKSLAEAKRIFQRGRDGGNVTANADPLSRKCRTDARKPATPRAPRPNSRLR